MFHVIHQEWVRNAPARLALEQKLEEEVTRKQKTPPATSTKQLQATESMESNGEDSANDDENTVTGGFMGFARFMAK